jgi:hypothetical protein
MGVRQSDRARKIASSLARLLPLLLSAPFTVITLSWSKPRSAFPLIIRQTSTDSTVIAAMDRVRRAIPATLWIGLVLVSLALPWRIIQAGFLPPDDALRHAAKAISGKPWSEILVMRPDIALDHNPGWHWILGGLHHALGWEASSLVAFSVVALFVALALLPAVGLKRPETWVASLALAMLVFPYFAPRAFIGRPLLVTMAVTLFLLWQWSRPDLPAKPKGKVALSVLLVALSVWVHGSWYLLALIPIAFLLAQAWRPGLILLGCWAGGSLLGALLTGHPWAFLKQAVFILFLSLGQQAPLRSMVGEFQPLPLASSYPALLIVGAVLVGRKLARLPMAGVGRDPIFWMAAIGYGLGFWVLRFWLDWGIPALALWVALQTQEFLDPWFARQPWLRLGFIAFAVVVLFVPVGSDREGRWSQYGAFEALNARQPAHADWVPDPGGVLYNVDLSVFYETFYRNPNGNWRYILGFEPSLMRPEDLVVYRDLWQSGNAIKACAPWIQQMTPADRLVLRADPRIRPAIRQLEWFYAVTNTWVGRKPRVDSGMPAPLNTR